MYQTRCLPPGQRYAIIAQDGHLLANGFTFLEAAAIVRALHAQGRHVSVRKMEA